MSHTDPSCGLGWNTLAAIGHVETEHGTIGGGRIDDDGDGRADIDQIDDAALSAAEYLCRSGRLATTAGWIAAVHAYNADADYNRRVAEAAAFYAGAG